MKQTNVPHILTIFTFFCGIAAFQNPVTIQKPKILQIASKSEKASPLFMQKRFSARLAMTSNGDENGSSEKWSSPVENEMLERVESAKSGVLSAISGSIVMAPFALLAQKSFYPTEAFSAQWEFSHDGLAIMLGLFGIVYRYAVRKVIDLLLSARCWNGSFP